MQFNVCVCVCVWIDVQYMMRQHAREHTVSMLCVYMLTVCVCAVHDVCCSNVVGFLADVVVGGDATTTSSFVELLVFLWTCKKKTNL